MCAILNVSLDELKKELCEMRRKFNYNWRKVQKMPNEYGAAGITWIYYQPLKFLEYTCRVRDVQKAVAVPREDGLGDSLGAAIRECVRNGVGHSEGEPAHATVDLASSSNTVVKYESSPAGLLLPTDEFVDRLSMVVGNIVKQNKDRIRRELGQMGYPFSRAVDATTAAEGSSVVQKLEVNSTVIEIEDDDEDDWIDSIHNSQLKSNISISF